MQKRSAKQLIRQQKLRIFELEEHYQTLKYFETMPEYDPLYTYCFSTSNRSISSFDQSVDAWVRAVVMHMATRRNGHGGAVTDAVVVSVPQFKSDAAVELWLEYVTTKLRKKARKVKIKVVE